MSVGEQKRNRMPFQQIIGVCHRLLELIVRRILLLIAYIRGPAHAQPPIRDLTLLHSATTLALKIRNKQVSIFILIFIFYSRFCPFSSIY